MRWCSPKHSEHKRRGLLTGTLHDGRSTGQGAQWMPREPAGALRCMEKSGRDLAWKAGRGTNRRSSQREEACGLSPPLGPRPFVEAGRGASGRSSQRGQLAAPRPLLPFKATTLRGKQAAARAVGAAGGRQRRRSDPVTRPQDPVSLLSTGGSDETFPIEVPQLKLEERRDPVLIEATPGALSCDWGEHRKAAPVSGQRTP
ncbi:hypothetical protein NDU88_010588 [Pleurodeles waltl]|uniref:Uncharacterized protein n=1 Tax=Pleurodeles waltl TaxID=8319 RepID=A0AAV7R0N0_PLEWA|nr:hypothetical protein NDU88_010588 [Pleurodeles waltl]